jgi:hypothetical protein
MTQPLEPTASPLPRSLLLVFPSSGCQLFSPYHDEAIELRELSIRHSMDSVGPPEGVWPLVTISLAKQVIHLAHMSCTSRCLYEGFIVFMLSTNYSLYVHDTLVSAIFLRKLVSP